MNDLQPKMLCVYSDIHTQHDPQYEIYDGQKEPYAEKAERLTGIMHALQERNDIVIKPPYTFSERCITSLHQKEYIEFLQKRSEHLGKNEVLYPSYFIMDTYTPLVQQTYAAAREAVNVALTGALFLKRGEQFAYALTRPPGHHAAYKSMGGYCYFNNAAIAANYLSDEGKVAILDIDLHHGNGTQEMFYERSDVLYVSLHADPKEKFPYNSGFTQERGKGHGLGYTRNYPLPVGTTDAQYLPVLHKALRNIRSFNPEFLVISTGFDTYEHDPIGAFKLTLPFYARIGHEIASLGMPTLFVQEGGYNVKDLGAMAVQLVKGYLENVR